VTPPATFPIRPVPATEWRSARAALARAFGGAGFSDETLVALHERADGPHRTLAAFDGEDIVGTTTALAHTITVPGAVRPAACISAVGVSPTHRGRGILTALMRAQLDAVHAEGVEAFAALWASEPAIYQRFGYGLASHRTALAVQSQGARFSAEGQATLDRFTGRLVLLSPDAARPLIRQVFERALGQIPGMFSRDDARWDLVLDDSTRSRDDGSELQIVVALTPDGEPLGYAGYRTHLDFGEHSVPQGRVEGTELVALEPGARAALWRYLLDLSLYREVRMRRQPCPDPVLSLLADPRRSGGYPIDALWLRIVDLPRALEERTYSAPLEVVLRVRDSFCEWNNGDWEVQVDSLGAATVRPAGPGSEADLELSVVELAAAHLGAESLVTLADAGRVRELRPGALVAAARAWSWHVAPMTLDIY
jgi:predicted acetyltransferase